MVQPGGIGHVSTSDTVKAKSKRPCLVVRPAVSPLKFLEPIVLEHPSSRVAQGWSSSCAPY